MKDNVDFKRARLQRLLMLLLTTDMMLYVGVTVGEHRSLLDHLLIYGLAAFVGGVAVRTTPGMGYLGLLVYWVLAGMISVSGIYLKQETPLADRWRISS